VHLAQFPAPEDVFSEDPTKLLEEWGSLLHVRDYALQSLEIARQKKLIGKALEADILISTTGEDLALLSKYRDALKEVINVSSVVILERTLDSFPPSDFAPQIEQSVTFMAGNFAFVVYPANGHKCARCWNFMPEVSAYGTWQNVCTRCQSALKEMGIDPPQPSEDTA